MAMWENWKAETRKELIKKRREWTAEEDNQRLFQSVLSLPQVKSAKVVYLYAHIRGEAATDRLMEYFQAHGILTALPKVEGREMSFYYVDGWKDLEKGAYGILEPAAHCRQAMETQAVMLVPGVAFTPSGERLGYGGGFYDRFLAREPEHVKIGLCFEFQLLEEMQTEPFDIRMNLVVTPDSVYDCDDHGKGRMRE